MPVPLTRLAPTLSERTGKPAPRYHQLYRLVLDGAIPATKRGPEWVVSEADLPMVKRVLGLTGIAAATAA